MTMTLVVQDAAVEAIERLRRRGFDAAQASASEQLRREQISEQRQLPVGLILLVSIVLVAVIVAIFLLK